MSAFDLITDACMEIKSKGVALERGAFYDWTNPVRGDGWPKTCNALGAVLLVRGLAKTEHAWPDLLRNPQRGALLALPLLHRLGRSSPARLPHRREGREARGSSGRSKRNGKEALESVGEVVRLPRVQLSEFPGGRRQAFVVYRGPSVFDGETVLGIVSGAGGSSWNPKTGLMAQLSIMRADVAPHEAQKTGQDVSVCGDCAMRPSNTSNTNNAPKCYVVTYQAPRSTWASRRELPENLNGCVSFMRQVGVPLRLGSYGDPAALPERIVRTLGNAATSITGYTHAWRTALWLRDLAMASVETEAQALEAQALGWRTFRVRRVEDRAAQGEIVCPAADESDATRRDGSRVQCISCRLCDGKLHSGDRRKNIVIIAHGNRNRSRIMKWDVDKALPLNVVCR